MKILAVSAYYPPHHIGGYEIGCRDVMEKLRARGHGIRVLTGNFRMGDTAEPDRGYEVHRILNMEQPGQRVVAREECRKLRQHISRFQPDLVFFWSQSELCRWLPFTAWFWGYPLAFFLSDTSFQSWRIGAWLTGPAQKSNVVRRFFGDTFLVRGWPVIQNRPCFFASGFLKSVAGRSGIRPEPRRSHVVHWGIEPAQFTVAARERWPVRRLLYAGQLIRQKGVHTAIKALALLAAEKDLSDLTLTVVGGGMQPEYEKELRALPTELGIGQRVNFLGRVPRADLPRVYGEHDALIFPSEWEEPFAITPLEAIYCGLAVVGTATGGSGELFRNRETAMTFVAGDAADCARAIRELCADKALFQSVTAKARREVLARHTLDTMVDVIEKSLKELE